MSRAASASNRWTAALGADARSMAACRIVLGVTALLDVLERATQLRDFYADDGYVPRASARALWGAVFPHSLPPWSLHALGGSVGWPIALAVVEGACALALVVGYRSRIAAAALLVLFLSHCQRDAVVCCAGDWALVAFLAWAPFAPLDAAWALRPTPDRPLSPGAVAIAGQLVMLLFFAGLQKIVSSAAWRDGRALGIVLHLDLGVTEIGRRLAALPSPLLRAVSLSVIAAETIVPWLLVLPVSWKLRTAAAAFVAAHLIGFAIALEVDLFPWIVLAPLLSRLPGEAWDALGLTPARAPSPSPSPAATRIAFGVVALGMTHALGLNVLRLGPRYAGPAWLEAPCGFLVPNQGWRMYRDASDSWSSKWPVLAGTRPEDASPSVRLPDGAPLDYDVDANAIELFGGVRWSTLFTYVETLRDAHPEVLVRIFERQCAEHGLAQVSAVLVHREGSTLVRVPFATHRCGTADLE